MSECFLLAFKSRLLNAVCCMWPYFVTVLVVQVFWLKDGERLDVDADVNLIISHEGSLIVSQARLSDSANYTCGAQNVAARRLTDVALLTVYGQSPTVTFPAAVSTDAIAARA